MNEGFVFYKSFLDSIRMLPKEEQLKAFDALAGYAIYGEEPQETGLFRVVYEMAKPQLDANQKRRNGGSKGGRPKQETNDSEEEKPMVIEEEKPMVSENENLNINIKKKKKENININNIYRGAEAPAPQQKKFIPPTVEEVQEYCRVQEMTVDAEAFVDFYASKGWMVGKNKMKDWKAACRNWTRSSRNPSPKKPNNAFCNFEQRDDNLDALAAELDRQFAGGAI